MGHDEDGITLIDAVTNPGNVEISPRQQILSSPNAMFANHAANADTATNATNATHATTAETAANFTSVVLKTDETLERVGVGTSSPRAKLDVNGDAVLGGPVAGSYFFVTGNKIQQFSGAVPAPMFLNFSGGDVVIGNSSSIVTTLGELRAIGTLTAPDLKSGREIRMESKSIATQGGVWPGVWVDLQAWRNRPDGCRMTIYAQHEIGRDIRTYEGTFVFEEAGYSNNPDFPDLFVRGACEFSSAWRAAIHGNSFKLGDGAGATYAQLMGDVHTWVQVYDYKPAGVFGGSVVKRTAVDHLWFFVGFHSDVSGRVVVKDN